MKPMKQTSPNGLYEFEVSSGVIEDEESVEDGVVMHRIDDRVELYENGRLQFEKDLRAPENGDVADNGVCAVIEGKNWDKPEAHWEGDDKFVTVYAFDKSGTTLLKQQFEECRHTDCAVDATGRFLAVVGPSAGNLLIYNTETGQEVANRPVEQIDYQHEIERVKWNGSWCFKLTDLSELSAVVLDTSGEVVESDISMKSLYEQTEERKNKVTIAGTLEDRGLEVPSAVYFVCAMAADQTPSAGASALRTELECDEELFEPDWSEFVFFQYRSLGLTYVIGPESDDEAISAFSDFASIERVDLPSADDLEDSVEKLSRTNPPDELLSMGSSGLSVSLSDENMIRTMAYEHFFGEYVEPSRLSVDEQFDGRFPDTKVGDLLEKTYQKKNSFLDEQELERIAEDRSDEIAESYQLILELLESGAFQPYTIDSKYKRPSASRILEPVAESNPELVLSHLDWACDLMEAEQSGTAAEVMCYHLQDLIQQHPDSFAQVSKVVISLLESQHAHPQRRAYDILLTAFQVKDQRSVASSVFTKTEFVSHTCKTIETTDSIWLQRSCCQSLSRYNLSKSDHETLAQTTEPLIKLIRMLGAQRGLSVGAGVGDGDILWGVHTEEELEEIVSDIDISSEAAYRTHRAAGNVLRIVASNRAEALLPYFETIWEDFTAEGDSMKIVRRVAFFILSEVVEAEPSGLSDILTDYTSEIIQLLDHEEDNRIRFAIDCLRIIDSEESIEALHRIHLDESHEHWQRATNALEEIAPEKIDPHIEPSNEQQAWIDFVTELAKEQGQLPRAKDVIGEATGTGKDRWKHPDAPNSEYWEVFEDSWDGVLASLDLETEYRSSGAPLRERLIQGLQATAEAIDGVPTGADFERETGYTTYNLKKEFGGIKAARRAAGVDRDSISETTEKEDASASSEPNPTNTTPTRSQLTEAIVELAESVEDTPTTTQMNNQGAFPMSAYYAEFDTWNEALEASGITPTRSDRSTATTRDDLRAELRRLSDELGRTPKTTDVKSESEFSLGRYYNEYNSWSEALSDAGFSG